jgi:hypothetical protein
MSSDILIRTRPWPVLTVALAAGCMALGLTACGTSARRASRVPLENVIAVAPDSVSVRGVVHLRINGHSRDLTVSEVADGSSGSFQLDLSGGSTSPTRAQIRGVGEGLFVGAFNVHAVRWCRAPERFKSMRVNIFGIVPSEALQSLSRNGVSARDLGSQIVDGVRLRRLRVDVTDELSGRMNLAVGATEVVWVNGHGQVARLEVTEREKTWTFDSWKYGVPVHVNVPTANVHICNLSEVRDLFSA